METAGEFISRLEPAREAIRNPIPGELSEELEEFTDGVTGRLGWVMFDPQTFSKWPWLISLSKFAFLGGLANLGLMAKDFNNHSTTSEVQAATKDELKKL